MRVKQPKGENVKYTKGKWLVMKVSDVPTYQIYERMGVSDGKQTYRVHPQGGKRSILIFRTVKAAKDLIQLLIANEEEYGEL